MARTAVSFKRSKSSKEPQPTVLIICEDSKSGKCYIEDAAKHFRIKVRIDIVHIGNTDPKSIVEEAVKRKKKYDHVFCVIDRDSHENWNAALGLANGAQGVEVIASYPCFEYWLILHFNRNRRPYAREGNKSPGDCCVSDLKQCEAMDVYDKGRDHRTFATLLARLPQAKVNSMLVYEQAEKDGEMNPSTKVHALINYFEWLEAELWH